MTLSPNARLAILDRDTHRCQYCATIEGPIEIDHVVPVSRGGTDEPSNLVASCVKCNRGKRHYLLSEWKSRKFPSPRYWNLNSQLMTRPTNVYLTEDQRTYLEGRAAERQQEIGLRVSLSDVMREAVDLLRKYEPIKNCADEAVEQVAS